MTSLFDTSAFCLFIRVAFLSFLLSSVFNYHLNIKEGLVIKSKPKVTNLRSLLFQTFLACKNFWTNVYEMD